MRKNYFARRGTSIAAAALSVALVMPMTQPVAFAQETGAAAEAPAQPEAPKADSNVTAYADAIYSPGDARNKGTISGSVKEIQQALVGFGNVQDSGKALEGVRVYAQWYEGVKTEHASPVYYTESDANGNFTLQLQPYVDAAGVEREFLADASVGLTTGNRDGRRDEKFEKIRIWAELPDSMQDQYRLVHQPAAGIFPGIGGETTPGTQGDGQWKGNKVQGVTIQYAQKTDLPPHLPKDKWVESTGKGDVGVYFGRAFWNLDVLQGALSHNAVSAYGNGDAPAAGLTVVGSYLNDDAVKKINEYAKQNFAGKTLRGRGWTIEDEQGLQKWINEQIAADGAEAWIAETVRTTTGADGKFSLYWKGIYGNNWTGTGGGINPPADKLHKLAATREDGSFENGNLGSKHVNMDWSYVQVLDKDGNQLPNNVGMMYPWSLGQWAGPKSGNDVELFGGDGALIKSGTSGSDTYGNWNIALYPAPLKFDVLEKNTYDNWARVGETVETETSGLPIGEGLQYYIQWTDKNGTPVEGAACGPIVAGADTRIPSCPLKVPADVEHGDTFVARLYQGADANGTLLAQDAFAVTTGYLEYPETDAKVGEEATANPVFDNPATEAVEPKLDTAEFSLDESKLPEGVTADQVKVDPATGVVKFTPKAGQEGETFNIPVKMVDTGNEVPVYDENGEPQKGEDGQPLTKPRTISHSDATFKVAAAPKTADTVQPEYGNTLVVPGEPATSEPKFKDKDGKDVAKPAGAKFAIPEDYVAPEGYTVTIDENTGVVTVEAPAKPNGETAEDLQVPVKVTYTDGSVDDVTAPFYLDTDGDGKPDKDDADINGDGQPDGDDDDDNDGIKDQDEKDKGSNPKDSNSAPTTIGDIPNQNGTVGKAIDPVKVVVTDAPAGSKVEVTGLPDGVTYNPETKQIEGTPTTAGTSEVKVVVKGKDGNPVTGVDGKPVEKTFTFTVVDKPVDKPTTAATVEPEYGNTLVVPGTPATSEPKFKDKDGKEVVKPEGAKFAIPEDYKAPAGYKVTIDENTGVVTVEAPAKPNGQTAEDLQVPVKVTYTDGSVDDVTAPFFLDTDGDGKPDKDDADINDDGQPDGDDDDDNDGIKDQDEKDKGSNPKDANSAPTTIGDIPNQNGTVGKKIDPVKVEVTDAPAGSKVEVTGLPDGVTYNPETKQIEGTPTKPGTSEVKVVVKGKDGNPVTGADGKPVEKTFTFTVDEGTKIIPGSQTDEVPADGKPKELDDKVQNPVPGLTGEVKDKDGKVIPDSKVEITPEGDIKVTVPQGTDPQDGKVTIKDKDGKPIGDDIAITITDETAPSIDNVKSDDKKITGTGDRPNEDITVTFPDGTEAKTKTDDKNKFEVPVPADKPLKNDEIIKAKDGNGNESERKVGATDADTHKPSYGAEDSRTGVKVGESADTPNPFATPAPVKDVKVDTPASAKYWKFTAKADKSGIITGQAPTQDNLKTEFAELDKTDAFKNASVKKTKKDANGVEVSPRWNEFVKHFTPIAKPETKVDFTFDDDSTNDALAKWDLLGKDGKSILDPNGDADDDGVTNQDEINKGSDPFDENSKPVDPSDNDGATTVDESGKQSVNPDGKRQDSGVKIVNKDEGTKVIAKGKDKDGNVVEVPVEVDQDGKVWVIPGTNVVPGKGGLIITVEDSDLPGGKQDIKVDVNDPSAGNKLGQDLDASYPKTSVKPGQKQVSELGLTKKADGSEVVVPAGTTATVDDKAVYGLGGAKWNITGVGANVSGQAPTTDALIAEFKKHDVKKDWNQFMTTFKPVAQPEADVTVKNSTGETTAKAGFELVGVDGKSILDPNGDFDGDGLKNKDEIAKGKDPFDKSDWTVDAGRCAASAIGFGLPLIALLPLGLASQVGIPGLTPIAQRIDAELKNVNTNIQQQLGIFDPALASQVDRVNAQLRAFGADLGTVAAGIVLIAAGILAGTVIYDNCKPGGPTSSVKDVELRGSSGNTVELSSKKEDNAKKDEKPAQQK